MARKSNARIRKQMWVDADVQGTLVRRIGFYWLACLTFITIPLLWFAIAEDPTRYVYQHLGPIWQRHWPIYLAIFCLVPLTMWDALRVSHRIAGPVLRIRKQLVRINEGEPFTDLEFRTNDFWQDLAGQINQLSKKTLS